jgi:hypothetical protein
MLQVDGLGFDSADVSDDKREYRIVATKAGLSRSSATSEPESCLR